ncbi:MAG: hypothetical protein KAI89_11150 [Emcibacter sp.]|nr:hypothetical protein [Emcibacter sp.]
MTLFAYTIFCDDTRIEKSNKTIYIGTYDGEINLLGKDEVMLPKFSITIALCITKEDKYENAEYVIEIPEMDPIKLSPPLPDNFEYTDDATRMTVKIHLELINVKIKAETKIITYVIVDRNRIESDRLFIIKGEKQDNFAEAITL